MPDPAQATAADVTGLALAARGIRKSFETVEVLHGVDFDLRKGEVHGLVGQNGAGKSTLVKILDGAYSADAGTIELFGSERDRDGGRVGEPEVAMVFQEFSLIPSLTVAQNISLNREPRTRLGLVDDREVRRRALDALASVGADIAVDLEVGDLTVGGRQLVEVAKALSRDASILILDEPTASLTAREIAELTSAIRQVVAQGISVIYISHHLEEVLAICDRVSVMRDGRIVLSADTAGLTLEKIIDSMLGRSLESALAWQPQGPRPEGPPVLRVTGLRNERLRDVSFELYPGEVLGVAGLLGSGRSEIVRALFGIDGLEAGSVEVEGRTVTTSHPWQAIDAGLMLVPEDRARAGLIAELSVGQNILVSAWERFTRRLLIDDRAARAAASGFVDRLGIRTPSLDEEVRHLSGGNQQKVVVAKSLSLGPRVLLLDDPTVGIDIASKFDLLTQVRDLTREGMAVLLISSEFEELSALSDRILVIRDGAVAVVLDRAAGDDVTEEAISRAVQVVARTEPEGSGMAG